MRVLITGSTDGIGEGLARRLVEHGAEVVVHGRNQAKADAAAQRVGAAGAAVADLESFAQVRALAAAVGVVDVLVNNAGIGYGSTAPAAGAQTEDGHEPTWQVNVLSGFLLTSLLRDGLARAVHVSSGLHTGGEGGDPYSRSKLAQVMLAREAADRWPDLRSVSCSPGWIATKMGGSGGAPLAEGVDTPFWLVTADGLRNGGYFASRREQRPHARVEDAAARARLWDEVEAAVAPRPGDRP